jgi:CrcB protein
MERLLPYVLVGVGGFVGANARYVTAKWVGSMVEGRFPLGTFLINVSGSFLLGLLGAVIARKALPNADALRLALGVGFLGAYTTFSTFTYETIRLIEEGSVLLAALNAGGSLALGFGAVFGGLGLGRAL